uniref:Membrane-bound transcription factor site-2 protease n=1 Tax=Hirondellea gigas TaxID=1518452 RepID=A0A6A7FZI9_9CRUS
MEMWTFLTVTFLIHFFLSFTDFFLKSCMCHPYLQLVHHLGVTIKPLQVRVCTTLFNRPLAKWALRNSKLHRLWFTVGVVVVLCAVLPSIVLLFVNVVQWVISVAAAAHPHQQQQQQRSPADQQMLQPVVPGVNLSSEDLPVYFLTLLVSSVLHEAGHALAAFKEGVHVDGVGLLLVFILPGAFVMLPADAVAALHPYRRLKIFCAGVWHNLLLVLLAVLVATVTPVLLLPLYTQHRGAVVTSFTEHSPARGPRGLIPLDVVSSINDCRVESWQSWHDCLLETLQQPQSGYCVPDHLVANMDETVQHYTNGPGDSIVCCPPARKEGGVGAGADHLCFELLAAASGEDGGDDTVPMHPFTCLPARPAVAHSPKSCRNTKECPKEHFCLAPSLEEGVRLLRIVRSTTVQQTFSTSVNSDEHNSEARTVPVIRDNEHNNNGLGDHGNTDRTRDRPVNIRDNLNDDIHEQQQAVLPDVGHYRAGRKLTYHHNSSSLNYVVKEGNYMHVNNKNIYENDNIEDENNLNIRNSINTENFSVSLDNSRFVFDDKINNKNMETTFSVSQKFMQSNSTNGNFRIVNESEQQYDQVRRLVKRAAEDKEAVAASVGLGTKVTDEEECNHDRDVPQHFNDVLFLGSPAQLFQTVTVSDYIPRFSFVPLGLAESLLKLCEYFIKFSGALALLNVVPCVYLDGQYISDAVIDWIAGDYVSAKSKRLLKISITACGTVLLFANVFIGLMSLR